MTKLCEVCKVENASLRTTKKTCSDKCRKQKSRYDASSIKIRDEAMFDWEKAVVLAEEFGKDAGWIQRGLEACTEAGVNSDYFIDKYLHCKPGAVNRAVDDASIIVQRRWRAEGRL